MAIVLTHRTLREWSLDNVKYAELHSDNWTALNNAVSELPLNL
jgi:hypothetical protein